MAAPFSPPSRPNSAWFFAGLASSFPDVSSMAESGDSPFSELHPCGSELRPGCRVFQVSRIDGSQATEAELGGRVRALDLKDQVLVFHYRGKLHAIDHQCPHSSYPLSNGIPFDIEDFGVVLSAGIRCPKHDWSFDLFTGQGDRGSYRLPLWEVQLRPLSNSSNDETDQGQRKDKEVWVRRKQRMG